MTASPVRLMVASATIMFASVGIGFYGISVLVDQLVQIAGSSVETVGAATSVFLLASCLVNPAISASMRLLGARWTMVAGGAVSAVGLLLVSAEPGPGMLVVAFLLLGAGSAACSFLPVSTMLVGIEQSRRSLGMTIGYSGGTLGGAVLAPLMLYSSSHWGFRPTTVVAAFVMLGIVTAGSLVLLPRGFVGAASPAPFPAPAAASPPSFGLRAAVATGTFWWLLAGLAVTGSTATAVQLQLLSIARFAELPDPATAAVVLALSVAASRFAGVMLLRLLSTRSVAMLTCVVQALAFALLATATSAPAFLLGAGLVGASIGLSVMLSPLLTVNVFGQRHFASIYAVILTITGVANAFAPVLIGWWYDAASGYTLSLVVFAAGCAASTLFFLAVTPGTRAAGASGGSARRAPPGTPAC